MRLALSVLVLLVGCSSTQPSPPPETVHLPFLVPVPYPEIEVCQCEQPAVVDLTPTTSSEIIAAMMDTIITQQECIESCQANERAVNAARETLEEARRAALEELERLNSDTP
jgi:hypothetical protein